MHAVNTAYVPVEGLMTGISSHSDYGLGSCKALEQLSHYLAEVLGHSYHANMARLYMKETGQHNVFKIRFLSRSQVNQLLVLLKLNAHSDFRIIEVDDKHVVFGNKVCPNAAMTGQPSCGSQLDYFTGNASCRMTLLFN